MKFNFKKRSKADSSYRVSSILGKFDLESQDVVEHFKGEIPLETAFDSKDDWQIGVIHGSSGSGKTQIAKHLFPANYIEKFQYTNKAVIEDFPKVKIDTIARTLNNVGFTTAKSYLKPYSVLSNGEKMRVDTARAILNGDSLTVFDEFTSVVDRKVAKASSFALQKAVRRTTKKFIAVTCHDDILEWLEPDWVFNTDEMKFTKTRGKLRRPKIKVEIVKAKGFWKTFAKYHYMNHNLLSCSEQYVAFIGDDPVAFCAITRLVHNRIYNAMRIHRIVVLPDYQGINIGSTLLNFVSKLYRDAGERVVMRLSHPALIEILSRDKDWVMTQGIGRSARHTRNLVTFAGAHRRLTSGWEYKPTWREKK